MMFIKKNKSITLGIQEVKKNKAQQCETLLSCIKNGDLTHVIFKDQDCDLYFLALYHDKKIIEEEFLQIYIVLSVLMEFTSDQDVKESDSDFKTLAAVSFENMSVYQEVIKESLYNRLKNTHGDSLSFEEFEIFYDEYMKKSTPLESGVIK